jgi:hypothetical protein
MYDGAIETVKGILYQKGKSPNHGNLPELVVVHFPQYRDAPWDKTIPK